MLGSDQDARGMQDQTVHRRHLWGSFDVEVLPMRFGWRFLTLVPAFVLTACDGATAPDSSPDGLDPGPALQASGPRMAANGGGTFDAGVLVHFKFNAIGLGDMNAEGHLIFRAELGGLPIDFRGKVTCLAVDRVNHRAWIGGVITRNRSTHPSFTTPIHAVGKDIWFRVVDYGAPGQGTPDRTTFVGFEGGGGIITSAESCEAQIWPDDDARTGPVLAGNINVR
jgi:hypothetical protein